MTEPRRDQNPFELLEVPLDADDRTVRRAFARALRAAKASGDLEAVERVQRAFEAIRDAENRQQCRTFCENELRVTDAFDRCREALEAGEPERALAVLEKLLKTIPRLETALYQKAMIQGGMENYRASADTVRRLIDVAPQKGGYHRMLCQALFMQLGSEEGVRYSAILKAALASLHRARELGEDDAELLNMEAYLLCAGESFREARALVVEALEGAGELRTAEQHLFWTLLRIDAGLDRRGDFEQTLERIRRLLPDDALKRQSIAVGLCDTAVKILNRPEFARSCARLAKELVPQHSGVDQLLADIEAVIAEPGSMISDAHDRRLNRSHSGQQHDSSSSPVLPLVCTAVLVVIVKLLITVSSSGGGNPKPSPPRYDTRNSYRQNRLPTFMDQDRSTNIHVPRVTTAPLKELRKVEAMNRRTLERPDRTRSQMPGIPHNNSLRHGVPRVPPPNVRSPQGDRR